MNARRCRLPSLVRFAVLACALAAMAPAQGPIPPEIPPGFVLIDDLILPEGVVTGESVYTATPWPGGIIPYTFHTNVDATNQARSITAMAEWEAVAAVDFVPRTTQTNYIRFVSSTSNSSSVGMVGGMQNVNMVSWSTKYVICHELYHAMGYLHEQSRPDRDSFVTINFANVQSGYANNFQISPSATTAGPYDFLSIMHYGQCALSISCATGTQCACSALTIVCNPPYAAFQTQMGQRVYMTVNDAQGLAARYGAPSPPVLAAVSPPAAPAGGGPLTLTVDGVRFFAGSPNGNGVQGSRVRWNGTDLATIYVDPTRLTATVPAALLAASGCASITVHNQSPAGGTSNALPFGVASGPVAASVAVLGAGCGGGPGVPALALSAPPVLGSSVSLQLGGAAASRSGLLLLGFGPPVSIALGGGCTLRVDPGAFDVLPIATDVSGSWSLPVGIPADACLAGFRVVLQAGVTPTSGPLGWDITNGLDVRFGW